MIKLDPPIFVFPNLIPGRSRLPPEFKLTLPVATIDWPAIPTIPPFVQTGDLITAVHENTVTQALDALWIDLQWLAGGSGGGFVPTARQIIAGAGLSGGGPLSADVTLSANVTSVFGRTGAVVLTAADISGTGYTAADDTSTQRIQAALAGTLVGTRHQLNFIASAGVTWNVVDNAGAN